MIEINYEKLKKFCEKTEFVKINEVEYIEDGVLGKFYPPRTIYITDCKTCGVFKQRKVLVLLHEMCHYFKYWQCGKPCEEACFEFEAICNGILNEDKVFIYNYEAVGRLGLMKPMLFLHKIIDNKEISNRKEIL